ncbi:MAG: EamA family transporter, partial [Christensenellaceae bacterium]|nr:EamA family transporter [Christensenellaceae bacterium]
MSIALALLSAAFSSLTAIFSKRSLKRIKPQTVVFLRTCIIIVFLWIIVTLTGSYRSFSSLNAKNMLFLALSGLATGGSWMCYYKALSIGDVNKVVTVDKSSVVLTVVISVLFLHESLTPFKILGLISISLGIFFMLDKKQHVGKTTKLAWLPFAAMSAIFAALTSVFAKVGLDGVDSNLATALRTCVVLVISAVMAVVVDYILPLSRKTQVKA